MTDHQKSSWYVCSVVGALTALLYMIVVISILCINIAEGFGVVIPQLGMQYTDFWAYIPRILLSVSISVCYGMRWGIERAAKEPSRLSFRLMAVGIFALVLTFIEFTQ